MVPDWLANRIYFSDLLVRKHDLLWEHLARLLDSNGIDYGLLAGTRDIWVRDYMPVQVADDDFVMFRYEPDYPPRGRTGDGAV